MASLSGYAYQIWRSVLAWLDLGDKEVLDLEGAEDIDRLYPGGAETTQVKDTTGSGPITLRSVSAVEALNNFWTAREANPGLQLNMRFVSTTVSTSEKGNPFGERQGLQIWKAMQRRMHVDLVKDDLDMLREFLKQHEGLSTSLKEWLGGASDVEILRDLIDRVHWDLGEPGTAVIQELIDQRLALLGHPLGVFPTDAAKVRPLLLQEALAKATHKTDRRLTRAMLLKHFEAQMAIMVPRNSIAASIANASSAFGPPLDLQATALASAYRTVTSLLRSDLVLSPATVARGEAIAEIRRIAAESGFVYVKGSTGMGKSTLVQQAVTGLSPEAVWLDLRDLETPKLLRQVANYLNAKAEKTHLVLDDLSFSGDSRTLQAAIEMIVAAVSARGGVVIATGATSPPAAWLMKLGLDAEVIFSAPAFDQSSIAQLLEIHGMGPGRACQQWAKIIHLQTSGHPQLVSARAAALRRAGFSAPKAEDLLHTPADVNETKAQARKIVSELPPHDRELLYRLSLSTARLRRRVIDAMGKVDPPVHELGNVLDRLTGPWLELIAQDGYRASPLIQNCGAEVHGQQWAQKMHSALARAMFAPSMGPDDASAILLHALAGLDEWALVRMSMQILVSKDIDLLAGWLTWFLGVEPTRAHFSTYARGTVRMTQLAIACRVDPESAGTAALTLERETRLGAGADESDRVMRFVALGKILMSVEAAVPSRLLVALAHELDGLSQRRVEMQGLADDLATGTDLPDDVDSGMGFAAAIHGRLKSSEDFKDIIETLNELPATDRERLITQFGHDFYMSVHIVNTVWLATWKSKNPQWLGLLGVLQTCLSTVIGWSANELAAAIAMVIVRTLNDNLGHSDEARRIGESFINQFGDVPELVDAVADTFEVQNRVDEALAYRLRVIDRWLPTNEDTLGAVLGRRKAAISAIKLRKWKIALDLLLDAYRLSRPDNKPLRSGLLADAGIAGLRANAGLTAVDLLCDALDLLGTIPNTPEVPANFRVHKVIGHTVMELASSDAGMSNGRLDVLHPCVCSDFEVRDGLLDMQATPIDYTWVSLFAFGITAELVTPRLADKIRSLRTDSRTLLRVIRASSEARYAALAGDLTDVALRATDASRAMSAAKLLGEDFGPAHTSDPPQGTEPADAEFVLMHLVSATFVRLERGESLTIPDDWIGMLVPPSYPAEIGQQIQRWSDILEMPLNSRVQLIGNGATKFDLAMIEMSAAASPNLLERVALRAHLHLMRLFLSKSFLPELAPHLCRFITRYWRVIADQPFRLTNPRLTQSMLIEACSDAIDGSAKSSRVLLAAASATGTILSADVTEQLRRTSSPETIGSTSQ